VSLKISFYRSRWIIHGSEVSAHNHHWHVSLRVPYGGFHNRLFLILHQCVSLHELPSGIGWFSRACWAVLKAHALSLDITPALKKPSRFQNPAVPSTPLALLRSCIFLMALVHDEGSPYVRNNSSVAVTQRELLPVKRLSTESFTDEKRDFTKERQPTNSVDPEVLIPTTDDEADREQRRHELYLRFRPYILAGVALVILGWWISATILKATRHRWYVAIRSMLHER
jgi:hypothetical protein